MNEKNDQAKETAAHLSAEGKKKNSGLIFFAAFILVVIALILALNVVLQKKWPYKEHSHQVASVVSLSAFRRPVSPCYDIVHQCFGPSHCVVTPDHGYCRLGHWFRHGIG
ncbi:MAG: hypothetical protein II001_06360 [Bacteroidales bacterium]|nr:hypothetical protein [Bacteroidales bacterium]